MKQIRCLTLEIGVFNETKLKFSRNFKTTCENRHKNSAEVLEHVLKLNFKCTNLKQLVLILLKSNIISLNIQIVHHEVKLHLVLKVADDWLY